MLLSLICFSRIFFASKSYRHPFKSLPSVNVLDSINGRRKNPHCPSIQTIEITGNGSTCHIPGPASAVLKTSPSVRNCVSAVA